MRGAAKVLEKTTNADGETVLVIETKRGEKVTVNADKAACALADFFSEFNIAASLPSDFMTFPNLISLK